MSHIKNKGIFYVANGTDPNILGITPTSNLGLCKTQDGTKEWNYNDTLAPGSKWVLKDGGKKVYKFLFTQINTDDPIATILENMLGGIIIWNRDGVGNYIGTLTGAFLGNFIRKTEVFIDGGDTIKYYYLQKVDDDQISINVYLGGDSTASTPIDAQSDSLFIEIEVYP